LDLRSVRVSSRLVAPTPLQSARGAAALLGLGVNLCASSFQVREARTLDCCVSSPLFCSHFVFVWLGCCSVRLGMS